MAWKCYAMAHDKLKNNKGNSILNLLLFTICTLCKWCNNLRMYKASIKMLAKLYYWSLKFTHERNWSLKFQMRAIVPSSFKMSNINHSVNCY